MMISVSFIKQTGFLFLSSIALLSAVPAQGIISPERSGYAFDNAYILSQQHLFGIMFATKRLATACQNINHEAAMIAYEQWENEQGTFRDKIIDNLMAYHFGANSFGHPKQRELALSKAINLPQGPLVHSQKKLLRGCDSLPSVLILPRYNLKSNLDDFHLKTKITVAYKTQATYRYCRTQSPEFMRDRDTLEDRYHTWKEYNSPILKAAFRDLQHNMENYQPNRPEEGKKIFSKWRLGTIMLAKKQAEAADCDDFVYQLKYGHLNLDNVFPPENQ